MLTFMLTNNIMLQVKKLREVSMQKVHFITLGCKTNQYETNSMEQLLLNSNYEVTSGKADIYIINTCSVTNMAERKSREMIRRAKRENPDSTVIACGCYSQVAGKELEKLDEIDLIIGTNEKNNLVKILDNYFSQKENKNKDKNKNNKLQVTDVMHDEEYLDFGSTTYTELTRAIVKIQDGCDRFCSYCIIPYARGKVRSRKPESVIEEVKAIAGNGYKEVVITGIHLASYGKDFKDKAYSDKYDLHSGSYRLIHLLEDLNKIQGIERIRLGSIEPKWVNEEIVNRLSKIDKICHQFHLSLQSGCDKTLERMNRRYTTAEFEKSVKLLREAFPDVNLTTDVIVGFPGETDEEFNQTYDFLKKIKFYKMHVFKYSVRSGTKAEKMPNQVSAEIKEERSKKLLELSDLNELEYNSQEVGKETLVLFEEREGEFFKGHSGNYLYIKVKIDKDIQNKLLKIKITEAKENLDIIGDIVV